MAGCGWVHIVVEDFRLYYSKQAALAAEPTTTTEPQHSATRKQRELIMEPQ